MGRTLPEVCHDVFERLKFSRGVKGQGRAVVRGVGFCVVISSENPRYYADSH